MEFYFSDSNLAQDKFLFTRVDGANNLPVPISIIHSFKRMRHFQPLSAVIAALKESTILDVVDNDSCVQRKVPFKIADKSHPEVAKVLEDEAMSRTVYVKGFGKETKDSQLDIEKYFKDNYSGPINAIRLRRHADKTFKGSVFVEFADEKAMQAFIAIGPGNYHKFNDQELIVKTKKNYCDEKVDLINAGKMAPNNRGSDLDWKNKRGAWRPQHHRKYEKDPKNRGEFENTRWKRGNKRRKDEVAEEREDKRYALCCSRVLIFAGETNSNSMLSRRKRDHSNDRVSEHNAAINAVYEEQKPQREAKKETAAVVEE